MVTVAERIRGYLAEHPEGVDDDALAAALGLSQRQTANQVCRRLEQMGLVERRRVDGKLRNFLTGSSALKEAQGVSAGSSTARARPAAAGVRERPWHWEGSVQARVVTYLASRGYDVIRVADTSAREQGKDIEARAPDGRALWVTVKGYPQATERTNPATQARHWFKDALFDVIDWRGRDDGVDLAIGLPDLPDHPTYRHLAERVQWLREVGRFRFFWVGQDGSVQEDAG